MPAGSDTMTAIKKILIIRFSSIGDIIYTSPVVRCLKQQIKGLEIHYITKQSYSFLLSKNPYLDKLIFLKPSLKETIKELKAENYDHIIDLHNTIRSSVIKFRLGVPSSTFDKQRLKKWMALKFKINRVKPVHLVDRYLETVKFMGVVNDQQPIDYFMERSYRLEDLLPPSHQEGYIAMIIGATHFTKRMPNNKVAELCKKLSAPVALLGGKDVLENGRIIAEAAGANVYNACGRISFDESVFLVKNAVSIIGFDTGLTHVAEAFNKRITSIWGSTIPELLGVQPYKVDEVYEAGVELPCRPCSKFGLPKCPLGHFKCMNDINLDAIATFNNQEK